MTGLTQLTAIAMPIDGTNIDTDRLLPARFLRKPRDENNDYREWLFHDLRFDEAGRVNADFPMNETRYQDAKILVADSNFGCGSSREGAVYALVDNGFRVIIAPSFGEIFAANCVRNGLAPLCVSDEHAEQLRDRLKTDNEPKIAVNLELKTVTDSVGQQYPASIDEFSRQCLIEGIDEISFTLQQADAIGAYETRYRASRPWLFQ